MSTKSDVPCELCCATIALAFCLIEIWTSWKYYILRKFSVLGNDEGSICKLCGPEDS